MAYNNYFPASYQPYYSPMMPNVQAAQAQAVQAQQQTQNRWDWTQGETGAKAYLVAPNTTVLLLDSESPQFFIKTADASGMPAPLRIFEYSEVTNKRTEQSAPRNDYATKSDIEALSRRIDEIAKGAEADE